MSLTTIHACESILSLLMRPALKISLITFISLIAFAANSVLCRLALADELIDPVLFTTLRLSAGAAMLVILVLIFNHKFTARAVSSAPIKSSSNSRPSNLSTILAAGSWPSSLALFIYALCFSVAYQEVSTGTGALVLFAAVQITLITVSIIKGHRLSIKEWLGLFFAFGGFVYLILPSIASPSFLGFALMFLSGIAWAGYTYWGLNSKNPLLDTCGNFMKSLPLVVLLLVSSFIYTVFTDNLIFYFEPTGIYFAIVSGAITSGLGYFLWYLILPKYNSTQAGILQLSVPLIATIGGILFVGESLTLRIIVASACILTGILMVILHKQKC